MRACIESCSILESWFQLGKDEVNDGYTKKATHNTHTPCTARMNPHEREANEYECDGRYLAVPFHTHVRYFRFMFTWFNSCWLIRIGIGRTN